ncbi:MAG: endonuclease III domain-containing protein [Myxococcota bacterium]
MKVKKGHGQARTLLEIYKALLERFGWRDWWPGDTPFEVCIGAILTQNTAWTNVERAISGMKSAGLLDPEAILSADIGDLAESIRPAGYFNVKAARLRSFAGHLQNAHGGDLLSIAGKGPAGARADLLSINGVGRETADSILLYALEQPVFVVDAYTRRIFGRLGLVREDAAYDEVQSFFMTVLPRDIALYNDYHAQIVELGKTHCKKTRPICGGCPVAAWCGRDSEGGIAGRIPRRGNGE